MFVGYWNKSVAFTYISVLSAVVGIGFVLTHQYTHALLALIVCGIVDSFDGAIARRCKRDEKACNYGVQIDSLADSIAFLALPAVFLLTLSHTPVTVAIAGIYVLLGVVRLAWFNVTVEESHGVFHGVPVTQIAITLPFFYVLVELIKPSALAPVLTIVHLIVALLFVTDIRIPKPRGLALLVIVFLFVLTAAGLVVVS
ncbi:MAG: CDP-alcohol phosphatidyltransferase family protein [Actinomycetaceae bacterium]|nr:CDP-alcohol phosphatidyltransferase family protein [Actinomycetaceae bacterium]